MNFCSFVFSGFRGGLVVLNLVNIGLILREFAWICTELQELLFLVSFGY